MRQDKLISKMIDYYAGDVKRINHFLKVYALAKSIGESEDLEDSDQEVLEVVAIIHDIGIKIAESKYQSSSGKYQEIEGPAIAKDMLTRLAYKKAFIDKVCYIVGHHHTYTDINSLPYQILVEADFLVNIDEDQYTKSQTESIRNNLFKTKCGINYLTSLYKIS